MPRGPDEDLTADQCKSLLLELLQCYYDPSFTAKLAALQACDTPEYLRKLGPLVLTVQAPLLSKYGLEPNASGVDAMKHAIMRRIAEGAPMLQELANEARRVLGIAPIPGVRGQTAEDALVEMVNAQASDPRGQAEASQSEFEASVLAARNSREISPGSAELLLKRAALRDGSCETGAHKPDMGMQLGIRSLLQMARARIPLATLSGDDRKAYISGSIL